MIGFSQIINLYYPMENLKKYLQQQLPLHDIQPLLGAFSVTKIIRKGDMLVRPGQRSSFLAFINTGALRVYYYDHAGNEITTWFSFENMFISDLLSYYKDSPATQNIQAIEDCELFIAQKQELEKLYLTLPEFQQFGRSFAEQGMVIVMERMINFQTKSTEERYKELLSQPQFMQRIALKYLATYLGITDTSLSRIRRNIS